MLRSKDFWVGALVGGLVVHFFIAPRMVARQRAAKANGG